MACSRLPVSGDGLASSVPSQAVETAVRGLSEERGSSRSCWLVFTAAAKMTGKAGFSGGGCSTGRPLHVSSRCLASGLQPAGQMDTPLILHTVVRIIPSALSNLFLSRSRKIFSEYKANHQRSQ